MEYKGKISRPVYHPLCRYNEHDDDFNDAAIFSTCEEAMDLILNWVHRVIKCNPNAFQVEIREYDADVKSKKDGRILYHFGIDLMNLFD